MPLPAYRIATTSRITCGYSHEHVHGKTTPPRASQCPRRATRDDGRDNGTLLLADMTTRRSAATPPACLPTRRRNAERHGEYCYPPHDTTTRDERRDEETGSKAGRETGRKKTGRPLEKKGGPENGTRYEIKQEDCYSPSLSESSGKRGKSSNRER